MLGGVPGWVKIGRAVDIDARIRDLQIGHPVPLRLLAVLSPNPMDEAKFHRRWRKLRGSGEWFRFEGDLAEHVTARMARPKRRPARPRADGRCNGARRSE